MRADFVLDYDVLTVQQPHKLYLIARLTTGAAPTDHGRRPLNLSLVIDHSGSMAGDKLDYTKQAAQFLVQNLSSRDILSIVLYNNRVDTLLAPAPVQHKDTINQRIEEIRAGGTTNLSGGLAGSDQACGRKPEYRLSQSCSSHDRRTRQSWHHRGRSPDRGWQTKVRAGHQHDDDGPGR